MPNQTWLLQINEHGSVGDSLFQTTFSEMSSPAVATHCSWLATGNESRFVHHFFLTNHSVPDLKCDSGSPQAYRQPQLL